MRASYRCVQFVPWVVFHFQHCLVTVSSRVFRDDLHPSTYPRKSWLMNWEAATLYSLVNRLWPNTSRKGK